MATRLASFQITNGKDESELHERDAVLLLTSAAGSHLMHLQNHRAFIMAIALDARDVKQLEPCML
jgi:hypothetical protein